MTRYRTIVADPPWPYEGIADFPDKHGNRANPYPSIDVDEIATLPVERFADHGAHLYLWTINEHVEAAYRAARCWGFRPTALLVWCKDRQRTGLGGLFPSNTEYVLFCRYRLPGSMKLVAFTAALADSAERARITAADINAAFGLKVGGQWWISRHPTTARLVPPCHWPRLQKMLGVALDGDYADLRAEYDRSSSHATGRWFTWPSSAHSQKPEAFFDLVEQVSPGPYLELFARRQRLGWDTWGNEALEHVDLDGSAA